MCCSHLASILMLILLHAVVYNITSCIILLTPNPNLTLPVWILSICIITPFAYLHLKHLDLARIIMNIFCFILFYFIIVSIINFIENDKIYYVFSLIFLLSVYIGTSMVETSKISLYFHIIYVQHSPTFMLTMNILSMNLQK